MTSGKGSKLLRYIEHRLRVTLLDSRIITGTFLAFDKHLNLVLSDAEEFRTIKSSSGMTTSINNILQEKMEKRNLGLIILRGENVVSIVVEGPPPSTGSSSGLKASGPGGPGVAVGAGRGSMQIPPPGGLPPGVGVPVGLGAAPVHGVGGMVGMGRGMPPSQPPPGMF